MQDDSSFEGCRLDLRNECVWRGTQAIYLTTKAFTVLRLLIECAGQLVAKTDPFAAGWSDTAVSDAALTVCIGEIRKALGNTAQAPRFVATVHRRAAASDAATAPASAHCGTARSDLWRPDECDCRGAGHALCARGRDSAGGRVSCTRRRRRPSASVPTGRRTRT